jgi:hypothetical protein
MMGSHSDEGMTGSFRGEPSARHTALDGTAALTLTDGEVNCILGFLHDGSIAAEPWHQLMGAWGYCEHHAWMSLAVEMSALKGFISRSAFLYFDLLRHAVPILAPKASRARRVVARRLAARDPCMLCEINPRRRGWLSDEELSKAKDQTRLRQFAESLAPLWQGNYCPRCIGAERSGRLCRRHLEAAIRENQTVNLDDDYQYLSSLLTHVETYAKSFMWDHRDSDSPEDRAALFSAIGWCSGWSSLATLVGTASAPHG